ncbi:hypothetical protein JL193_04205 [Polaribacter batillariae]|uniref:Uncharacterized protein n=1 Tax=Polaribacter batillariae TaxID=2808900 RepID=A0ABX7SW66_9FLAO|nr:hypothetical protein [Polaribacter batillariae]QTD38499.1 hypothetical protein JL193_04205 [Polaribacter batillariae]
MKNFKIKNLWMLIVIIIMAACSPIEDRDELVNSTDIEGVELVATQSTPGGNKITLSMVTPGVTGHWDYGLGLAFTDKVEFVYPIPGKSTFTYNGTLGAEFFSKTIEVQIDALDTPIDQDYYDLVSANTAAGKTWVFNGTGGDGGLWWYMVAPNNPDGWQGAWWNAGGTCCPPPDATGSMKFDLNGGANFTYTSSPGATPVVSSFNLDVENQTLTIVGGNILGAQEPRGNPDGKYTIISLTETELILYVPTNGGGTGWTWVFKPQ